MDKLKVTKFVARFTAELGTATIVKSIIENQVQPENKIQKITVWVGTFVIVGMSKDVVSAATDARIDKYVAKIKELQEKAKEGPLAEEVETV